MQRAAHHAVRLGKPIVGRARDADRVVDEDGDQCVLEDVRIDGADKWVITDKELLACQAAS